MAKLTKFAKKELKAFKREHKGRFAFSRDVSGNTGLLVGCFVGARVATFTSALVSQPDQNNRVKIRRKYGEWLAMQRYQDQQTIPVHVYHLVGCESYDYALENACDRLTAVL